MARTFGLVEGPSYTEVVAATDRATKAADIRVVRYERVGKHDMAVVLEGDREDIRLALQAVGTGDSLSTAILANTRYQFRSAFGLPRWL